MSADRLPFHSSLLPSAPCFNHQSTLDVPLRLQQGDIIDGFFASEHHVYRPHSIFRAVYHGQDVIIKRSPASEYNLELKSFDLVSKLSNLGAPVCPYIEKPLLQNGSVFAALPYFPNRIYSGSDRDFEAILAAIKFLSDDLDTLVNCNTLHIVDRWIEDTEIAVCDERTYGESVQNLSKLRLQTVTAHNDIHPGNILLSNEGQVHFIDFEEAVAIRSHRIFDMQSVFERFSIPYGRPQSDLSMMLENDSSLSQWNLIPTFKSIGILKNEYYFGLARKNSNFLELQKFASLINFWSSI